ncbi:MAG: cation:proton antiporter subunit C [Rhodospirillaceae bacterium]
MTEAFKPIYDLWLQFEAFMAGPGSPGLFGYWIVIALMMIGFYIVITHDNLIKKIVGLNVFQVSVFLFYILMAKVTGGTAPILADGIKQYSNPLPHVLILTAIVVGVATTALGLALVVRIRNAYDSIEDDEILAVEEAEDK